MDVSPPFWSRLDPADRQQLMALGVTRRFAAGAVIVEQGEQTDHLFVVHRGCVKVTATTVGGYRAVLGLRGPGELVGEMASVDGGRRSAALHALTAVEATILTAARFAEFRLSRPGIDLIVQSGLSLRLREADLSRVETGAEEVGRRLAALLLQLAQRYGRPAPGGAVVIGLPLSQDDLAGLTLASKRTVARILRHWRDSGWVATHRREIVLADVDALRRVARG